MNGFVTEALCLVDILKFHFLRELFAFFTFYRVHVVRVN